MAHLFPIPSEGGSSGPSGGMPVGARGEVRFGCSWRFDYDRGDFVLTPTGKIAGCTDAEAWLEWCRKALRTERYAYLAYSRSYGQEYDDLISRSLSRQANELEIVRITTETLMTDPRTSRVGGFSFAWEGDRCTFQCEITNVRGLKATIEGKVVTD